MSDRRRTFVLLGLLLALLGAGVLVAVLAGVGPLGAGGASRGTGADGETPPGGGGGGAASAEGPRDPVLVGVGGRRTGTRPAGERGVEVPEPRDGTTVVVVDPNEPTVELEGFEIEEFVEDADTEAEAEDGGRTVKPLGRVGTRARFSDDEPVYSVVFTPDARLVLSAGEAGEIVVRDVKTGRIEATLPSQARGDISDLALDAEGRRVLSCGEASTVCLWDLEQRTLIRKLEDLGGNLYHVSFDHSGRRALVAGSIENIVVWDLVTGEVARRFEFEESSGADFSEDGRLLAAVSDDGNLRLWDYASGNVLFHVEAHSGAAWEVAFVAGTPWIMTCGRDGNVKLWKRDGGALVREWKAHDAAISEMAISPDSRAVATGGWKGHVRHWRIETGERLWNRFGHDDYVVAMAYDPDGRFVASGARDGVTRLWDAETGEPIPLPPDRKEGHAGAVSDLLFVGHNLVSTGTDGTMRVWNAEGTEWTRIFRAEGASVTCVALAPDGSRVLAGDSGGTIHVWDLATGEEVRRIQAHKANVTSIVLVDAGRTILTTGQAPWSRRIDLATGQDASAGASPMIDYSAFAVDTGSGWTAGARPESIDVLAADGTLDRTLEVERECRPPLSWLPDGRSLLVTSQRGALYRVDAWSGEELHEYAFGGRAVDGALTPDGRSFVLVSDDGRLQLLDVEGEEERRSLGDHGGDATCLALRPDGRVAATGGKDGSIYLWSLVD